ncbi:hypothetical protein LCGC14_2802410, partial [marine sediment metagenome]
GLESPAISDMFKELSMVEMKHAYAIAERVDLLGGVPSTTVGPIKVGGDLREMVDTNLKLEYDAIEMYKKLVKTAEAEDDPVSRRLMEDILGETEEHASRLEAALGK